MKERKGGEAAVPVLTREQVERLAPYAAKGMPLDTLLHGGYTRNIAQKDLQVMRDVYKEATGEEYKAGSWGCSGCVRTFVTLMAKAYAKAVEASGL